MRRALLFAVCIGLASMAAAQGLPSEPVRMAGGRVVLGGDVAVSVAPEDPGFFNYSDYEHNTLREVRLGVAASVRASDRISFLGEIRSENFETLWPFALYARISPLPGRRLDVQIGRIPPTFGAFTRRAYSRDNPLIGYPLAYQYLTSMRANAIPANADELLRMRGRGWLTEFSIGNLQPQRGVPLVTAFRWDTGVQVSAGWRGIGAAFSVTTGTASNPLVTDDNSGKQVAARVTATPATGLVVGASLARGQFLSTSSLDAAGVTSPEDFVQRALGLDVEYSRDRWLIRADALHSRWHLPLASEPLAHGRLDAFAGSLEGRFTIVPGIYAAARAEHLAFSRIASGLGTMSWDAPVSRVEVGGGYYLRRNAIARVSWQYNDRKGGRTRHDGLVAAQLLYGSDMRVLAFTLAAIFTLTGHGDGDAGSAAVQRITGVLRGRVDIRRTNVAQERRPTVTELGAPAARPAPEARRAVVYLETAPIGAFDEDQRPRMRMDQRNETFVPHLLAIPSGTIVDFPNSDSTYHNVFSLSKAKRFDLGRYARGRSKAVRFDTPGIVRVFCDIHSHMSAFVLVFGHPYFTTTDADGQYRIDNIPPGTYTVVAWHEGQTRETRLVVIPSQGGIVEQDFQVQ